MYIIYEIYTEDTTAKNYIGAAKRLKTAKEVASHYIKLYGYNIYINRMKNYSNGKRQKLKSYIIKTHN